MRLKASFTIEFIYVWAIIMFSVTVVLSIAYKEHYRISSNFLLHTAAEEAYHLEEDFLYNKNNVYSKYKQEFNKEKALKNINIEINIMDKFVSVDGKLNNMSNSIRINKYNPEGYMRMTAVLEGIYERYKSRIQERKKQ